MPRNRKARNYKPPRNFLEALGSVEAVDAFIEVAKPGYRYSIVKLPFMHKESDHMINIGGGNYQVFGHPYRTRVAILPQGKFRHFR